MFKNVKVWEKIIKDDILYNSHQKSLSQFLDINKTLKYFTSNQSNQGYFYKDSPMIYDTFYFCGMLNCINEKPSQNTINYLKSLQVGSLGFSETTGEMAWTDKSYLAIHMFKWLDINVLEREKTISFFQNFQNNDGGFGSIISGGSNFSTSINTIKILDSLNSQPKNIFNAINWLKNNKNQNLYCLFHYINSLKILNYKFSDVEKAELIESLNILKDSCRLNYENRFYYVKSNQLLDKKTENDDSFIPYICSNSKENFYLAKLLCLNNKIDQYRNQFREYINNNELEQGGFHKNKESIIKNGFIIHSIFLLDSLNNVDKGKFIDWLKCSANSEGWGSSQGMQEYHEYTVASLLALKILEESSIKNKSNIIKKAKKELKNVLHFSGDNNYYVLRTVKNSLEKLMLLNIIPKDLLKTSNSINKYYCPNGGFGSKNIPYLYATFWGIRSLFLIEKYMNYSGKIFLSKLNKIRDKTSEWIKSCQNSDGGFGPMPNQPSNIQSTFCAHYSLWMLNQKPKDIERAVEWILSLQKADGGFAGSKEMESEMLHILYTIGSLVILKKAHDK